MATTTTTTVTTAARRRGFTLMELLIVISIIILVSAVALPTILPALSNRQSGEGARLVQAVLAGVRDSAIRYNAPRGVRLLPDPALPNCYSRMILIEPAADLTDGLATFVVPTALKASQSPATPAWANGGGAAPAYNFPYDKAGTFSSFWSTYPYPLGYPVPTTFQQCLIVEQAVYNLSAGVATPNAPTNWFWNVRVGDKFRFNDSGQYYTVVGPMTVPNPEYFVNDGKPGTSSLVDTFFDGAGTPYPVKPEFLFLVNGVDDNGVGYVDPGFDGINENVNMYNGNVPVIDELAEWALQKEQWVGAQNSQFATAMTSGVVPQGKPYVITRRPVPSPSAREVSLPGGVVIDATTLPGFPNERSRLPVDPLTGNVDVMLNQAGQVVPTTVYSSPASAQMFASFYHFWISDRTDVHEPHPPSPATGGGYCPTLPLPSTTPGFPPARNSSLSTTALKKEMQLVTLFTRTGAVVTNGVENFDVSDPNAPFYDAQNGARESK